MQLRSPLLAALRVLWAIVPLVAGPSFAGLLEDSSGAVPVVGAAILWSGWSLALLATLVPSPLSLTAMRMVVAGGVAAVAIATGADPTPFNAIGAATAVAAAAFAFAPETGIRFANGVAYPNERRFPLRVPAPLVLGPLPVAWAATVGGPVAAALLLAAGQWVPGAVAGAVSVPVAVVLARAVHGLARRWLVFVPAGLVVHDPMTLTDPVLFPRAAIASLAPAAADSAATDFTQRAMGLALELRVHEPAQVSLVHPGRRQTESVGVRAILLTPTRPGAVLAEARRRQIGRAATPPPSTTSPS